MPGQGKPFGPTNKPMGRPKGAIGELTRTVRDAVKHTFDLLQTDPDYKTVSLPEFAKKNPRDFYYMASKLIPTEITGTLTHEIVWNEEKKYEPEDGEMIHIRAKDEISSDEIIYRPDAMGKNSFE